MSRRGPARFLAAAFAAAAALPVPARAEAQTWILEHFGEAVTILRFGRPGAAGLLLSCDGRDRRLAITLPETGTDRLGTARDGVVLIRKTGSSGARADAVIARFTMARGRTLTLSDPGSAAAEQAVLPVARMLAAQPGSLDILIHAGAGPVTWRGLVAYHLPVPAGPGDRASIAEFVAVCAGRGAPSP